jgi:hypothetical protein
MAHKKKLNRREFAKLAGGAALAVPVGAEMLAAEAQATAGQARAARSELKLSAEQEEHVQQARERTARQMRGLRERPIGYEAEPAFVFRARVGKKKDLTQLNADSGG